MFDIKNIIRLLHMSLKKTWQYSDNSFNNIINLQLFTAAFRKDFQHHFSDGQSLKLQNALYRLSGNKLKEKIK